MTQDQTPEPFDREAVLAALRIAWSAASNAKWTPANPALGQCSATALVIQDLFGGELLQTPVGGLPHFYNRIAGMRVDLTESQFSPGETVEYLDLPAARVEALEDTSPERCRHLAERLVAALPFQVCRRKVEMSLGVQSRDVILAFSSACRHPRRL